MAYDDDDYDWDDEESDESGDEPTVLCPFCNEELLEDTPRCPHCGQYLSAEDFAARAKPTWVIVTALVCLGIALWWVFAGW
jgi:predicted amidophosphoribosyltransferase